MLRNIRAASRVCVCLFSFVRSFVSFVGVFVCCLFVLSVCSFVEKNARVLELRVFRFSVTFPYLPTCDACHVLLPDCVFEIPKSPGEVAHRLDPVT